MTLIVTTFLAAIVPNVDQYYCKLQWVERKLCYYWCANRKRGFNWFEAETPKGCKLRKLFYKVEKEKTSA
tara:strand:- start:218 stop:427 length:210 start_codon:yes stop_codon:yes gene_type:complete